MAAPGPHAPFVAAMAGMGIATTADIQAAIAPLAAQLDALTLKVDALPTLAQINASIAAALAQHNAPAIAATAAATAQAIAAARARNAHDRDGEVYAVVPRADGAAPAHWPPGLDRAALAASPIADVNALLAEYQLPAAGTARARRNALALHIGTVRL
jgi:hypothetical protein